MTQILSNRQTRRRGIVFAILIAITLLLMAFSAQPVHPGGPARRSRSPCGRSRARSPTSPTTCRAWSSAIAEIDSLRIDNASLRNENERLTNENARLQALERENDELTAALQLQGGFNHETVATRVIGRDSLDTRQMVTLDKGTDDGIAQGDVVIVQGGALAGRVTDVGPTFAKVTLISDGDVDGGRAAPELRQDGRDRRRRPAASLVMRNIDSTVQIGNDEEVFTAGHRDQRRDPVALPEGPRDRERRRRRARRERRGPDRVPRPGREPRLVRGGPRDHRLRRRPAAGRRAGRPVRARTARCPRARSPATRPPPGRPPARRRRPSTDRSAADVAPLGAAPSRPRASPCPRRAPGPARVAGAPARVAGSPASPRAPGPGVHLPVILLHGCDRTVLDAAHHSVASPRLRCNRLTCWRNGHCAGCNADDRRVHRHPCLICPSEGPILMLPTWRHVCKHRRSAALDARRLHRDHGVGATRGEARSPASARPRWRAEPGSLGRRSVEWSVTRSATRPSPPSVASHGRWDSRHRFDSSPRASRFATRRIGSARQVLARPRLTPVARARGCPARGSRRACVGRDDHAGRASRASWRRSRISATCRRSSAASPSSCATTRGPGSSSSCSTRSAHHRALLAAASRVAPGHVSA